MSFWKRGQVALDDVAAVASGEVEVRQFVVGPISTNCYAVVSDGVAMVVDPGAEGARLAEALSDVEVRLVVATHGHADHVAGVAALAAATGASFAMAAPDVELAMRARRNHAMGIEYDADAPRPDRLLSAGDEVGVGSARFRVLAAPGHTPGGIVLLGEGGLAASADGGSWGVAFVGDTIFAGTVGRTDLPGGSSATLMRSLSSLREEIPPATHLLCGHGDDTTMSWELSRNPFLR